MFAFYSHYVNADRMLKAKMSSRGQIALPKVIRDQLGLTDGVSMVVTVDGDDVILRKASEGGWRHGTAVSRVPIYWRIWRLSGGGS
jgi:AbrB family looped-hinge helix DNA binding protein